MDLQASENAPPDTSSQDWSSTYQQAVQTLYGLIHPPEVPPPFGHGTAAAEKRLGMMRRLMEVLGQPQDAFPAIHVTGTSGKGSTATMIAEVLRQAGLRVGLYSKPHVQVALERILIDGRLIHPQALQALLERFQESVRVLSERDGYTPTYTQTWVALALLAFAEANVDVAVVEVGVGGRLDDTNVVHPLTAVITGVGLDHTEYLGPTLTHIAREKAGIIKEGAPAVSGVTERGPARVIANRAQRGGSSLSALHKQFWFKANTVDLSGGSFAWADITSNIQSLRVGLLGEHQITNAAIAVTALRAAERRLGRAFPLDAYRRGLERAWLPGRLEMVQREPLVLLDAAHNAQKARALRRALDALVPEQPRVLVVGILADKASEEMLTVLAPGAQAVVVTQPPVIGNKRPERLERLAEVARQHAPLVLAEPDPAQAVERALAETPKEGVLCITGSLYLVGAVRSRWFPEARLLAQAAAGEEFVRPWTNP
ncbi:MAG TPA: Mur ligase family protein [Ktedonobacterales bacterium]